MKKTLLALALMTLSLTGYASPEERAGTFGFPSIALYFFGLGVDVPYHPAPFLDGLETTFWGGITYADISQYYYQDTGTGEQFTELSDIDDLARVEYKQAYGMIKAGLAQGLLYNETIDRNFLEAFVFLKSQMFLNRKPDGVNSIVFQSGLGDRNELFQNSILLGLSLDAKENYSDHYIYLGYAGELSAEFGPQGLQNAQDGTVDFTRFTGVFRTWLPIFDLNRESKQNLLSAMLLNYVSADLSLGENIPLNVLQSFGGRYPRPGIGWSVRGVDPWRFGTEFKAVFNTTLQMNIWGFYPLDKMGAGLDTMGIVPALVTFYDIGYYQGFEPQEISGIFQTAGFGLFINAANFLQVGLEWEFILQGYDNMVENEFPNFNLRFGYHY